MTSAVRAVRAVARLRALCQRLPHVATDRERRLLARFHALTTAPGAASIADVEALVAGWRGWWRQGRARDIALMADAMPADLVSGHRELATYALAARLASAPRHQPAPGRDGGGDALPRTS